MSEENTTQPSEEIVEETTTEPEPTAESTPEPEAAPEPVVEEKSTKGTECGHPSNTTGYHQKGGDGTCIYCGN